jgi:hypothetical protein
MIHYNGEEIQIEGRHENPCFRQTYEYAAGHPGSRCRRRKKNWGHIKDAARVTVQDMKAGIVRAVQSKHRRR